MRARHDECSRNALIRHISDHDRQPPVRQLERVVEVAADDTRRAVARRKLPAVDGGKRLRQELLLHQSGELELALPPLPPALTAHQLTDSQGGSRPPGEILQQLARVARVVLVPLRRAQRDNADQLAGADQRNEQVDAALAQPAQARGVEVDVAQQNRRGRLG
jgi:hypothetical protein